MARNSDPLSDSFGTDESDSWLGGLVADEDSFDRHALWRLGLWGFAAVGAVTLGILSGQLPVNAQRTQLAASEFAGRAKQVETSIHDNQLEARRLSAAIETLNSDRDRLFSRLSAIEQGLDVVTGSIKKADERPSATPIWPDGPTARTIESALFATAGPPSAQPQATTVAATPTEPERTVNALQAAPQAQPTETPAPATDLAAAPPPVIHAMPIPEPQAAPDVPKAPEETPIAVAEFGIDLGAANSIGGLRALWRGLVKTHRPQLAGLRPLMAVQERRSGLGLQLRLIAGPIKDAAAAAQICAALEHTSRECKTATFDGQRLSFAAEPEERAASGRPPKPRKTTRTQQPKPEVQQAEPERRSALSTMLGIR